MKEKIQSKSRNKTLMIMFRAAQKTKANPSESVSFLPEIRA